MMQRKGGAWEFGHFADILKGSPDAAARLMGSRSHPGIVGTVRFYETPWGTLTAAQVSGLPVAGDRCGADIFGFHIHSGDACAGDAEDPFSQAKGHYNPENCPHPGHAGDLPPLFGNNGEAFLVCLTNRFTVGEVIGRTVIVHSRPDDFTTQPAGNAGEKIACGVIRAWRQHR